MENTMRNIFWGYVSHVFSLIIKFISRTVFIYYLGKTYMGVNGLFTNILGVLSFTELGLGTAMNYALYKPVAEGNKEKIKSLMLFYKRAYRVIAIVITVIGLSVTPFLKYLINDPGNVGNVYTYYLIYIFDTATSYLVSYKFSLVAAEQKAYIMTNINMVISLIQTIVQIIVIILFQDFLIYLLSASIMGVASKVYISHYFNKHYSYLNDNPKEIDQIELAPIKKNVIALIIHKIGDVCVHQTDNILISAFISLEVVGKISNYNYIITTITGFLSVIFSAVIGSLGNLIASESKEHQYRVFKTYRFVGYWLYGFCALAFFILFQPFICIWAGRDWLVDDLTVAFICIERYNIGHRVVVNNFKSAAGIFDQDKWVAFGQAIINLVVSIVMVKRIGLPGIYFGTIVQGLFSTAIKPFILYKNAFEKNGLLYYVESIKYLLVEAIAIGCMMLIKHIVIPDMSILNIWRFIVIMVLTAIIPNIVYFCAFYKTDEFKYLYNFTIKKVIRKIMRVTL